MTTDIYINENKTETFKKGDTVVMHDCFEAEHPENKGKVWTCQTDSFLDRAKQEVVFLDNYSGYFLVKFLMAQKRSDTHVNLILKGKWFDKIFSGEKKEEYRDVTDYWETRIFKNNDPQHFPDVSLFSGGIYTGLGLIVFRHGYNKNSRIMIVECEGVTIGPMKPEWTESNWSGDVFILKLGKIVYRKNC